MAIKKTDLYNSLSKSFDELRGRLEASQYNNYVITMLFIKYVSDKYAGKNVLMLVSEVVSFEESITINGENTNVNFFNKQWMMLELLTRKTGLV